MAYTVKKLTDVEDAAAKGGFGEMGEARFATGALDATNTGLAYHVLRPNRRQAFGHRHNKAEEINVVLSGSGRVGLTASVGVACAEAGTCTSDELIRRADGAMYRSKERRGVATLDDSAPAPRARRRS